MTPMVVISKQKSVIFNLMNDWGKQSLDNAASCIVSRSTARQSEGLL